MYPDQLPALEVSIETANEDNAMLATDIDSNNKPDIIIGNSGSQNAIYLNKGNGLEWHHIPLAEEKLRTYDIISVDINNDGLIDIVEANSDAINRYYFIRPKN